MNINLNKFDPNVLGQFKQVKSDEALYLIRFKDEKPMHVKVESKEIDWRGNQSVKIEIGRENRELEAIVIIERMSANYYAVIGVYRGKHKSQRFKSIEEISNFLKQNFCKTLLG